MTFSDSCETARSSVKKTSYKISNNRTTRHAKKMPSSLINSETAAMEDTQSEQDTPIHPTENIEKEAQKPNLTKRLDFVTGKPNLGRSKGDAYLRAKVTTASGGELVIMLYEKAISNLTIVCDLLSQPNKPSIQMEIGSSIRNAQEIILELLYSLDIEAGGDFARKMSSIYSFMNKELSEALIEKSDVRIKPILDQLKVLLEAWRRANEQIKTQEQLSRPDSEGIQIGS